MILRLLKQTVAIMLVIGMIMVLPIVVSIVLISVFCMYLCDQVRLKALKAGRYVRRIVRRQ